VREGNNNEKSNGVEEQLIVSTAQYRISVHLVSGGYQSIATGGRSAAQRDPGVVFNTMKEGPDRLVVLIVTRWVQIKTKYT
jgi:hypothetical protein